MFERLSLKFEVLQISPEEDNYNYIYLRINLTMVVSQIKDYLIDRPLLIDQIKTNLRPSPRRPGEESHPILIVAVLVPNPTSDDRDLLRFPDVR